MEGQDEAERLHSDRYRAAERIHIREVDPISLADVLIDNTAFEALGSSAADSPG